MLVLLAGKPRTSIDELVADMQAEGDEDVSRRRVSTTIANLVRTASSNGTTIR